MSNFINLNKGQQISLSKMPSIDLSKGGRGLSKVIVGLGWDPVTEKVSKKGLFGRSIPSRGPEIDCDAFAFVLHNGQIKNKDNLVYFGNLENKDRTIRHMGDNLTGDGDGDDEQIVIDLSRINADSIVIAVNIYRGKEKGQHFGNLQNAFIRIVDMNTNNELCKFTLDNKYDGATSVIFGELINNNGEWNFKAIGEASKGNSISEVVSSYY